MIAQICVYVSGKPTEKQSSLVVRLTEMGFNVMVDSIHDYKFFFTENFGKSNHRAYYTGPLIQGLVNEINFELMGPPEFVIWFNDNDDTHNSTERWDNVSQYLNICIAGGSCPMQVLLDAKQFLGTYVVPSCLQAPKQEQSSDTVIMRDQNDYMYSFTDYYIKAKDLMIYSITKPFVEAPFTIEIKDFSKTGSLSVFTDLFATDEHGHNDWGKDRMDIEFLKQLWSELNMEGEFDIDALLMTRTGQFLPDGTECPKVEPTVYRKDVVYWKTTL